MTLYRTHVAPRQSVATASRRSVSACDSLLPPRHTPHLQSGEREGGARQCAGGCVLVGELVGRGRPPDALPREGGVACRGCAVLTRAHTRSVPRVLLRLTCIRRLRSLPRPPTPGHRPGRGCHLIAACPAQALGSAAAARARAAGAGAAAEGGAVGAAEGVEAVATDVVGAQAAEGVGAVTAGGVGAVAGEGVEAVVGEWEGAVVGEWEGAGEGAGEVDAAAQRQG